MSIDGSSTRDDRPQSSGDSPHRAKRSQQRLMGVDCDNVLGSTAMFRGRYWTLRNARMVVDRVRCVGIGQSSERKKV